MATRLAAILLGSLLSGCVLVDVQVANPVQGLTTVAVAPFFNLSQEVAVDGRRFAFAYYSELQKTPGFQVVPVGVTEQAIFDNRLQLNNPDDVLKLAEILGVDAVVVGGVTDYDPYYPPRIGLQVSWYSPRPWIFNPGVPTEIPVKQSRFHWRRKQRDCNEQFVIRAQSDELPAPLPPAVEIPTGPPPPVGPVAPTFDPRQPLMSYTRLFDGSDDKVVARLRNYVALSGDLRSGGWEGYLHRSEDFIRFTAHLMVVEMLQLHGGEAKRRFILTWPKQR